MKISKDITTQPWKIMVRNNEELEKIDPQLAKYGYEVRTHLYRATKPIVLYVNAEFCSGKNLEYNDYPDPKTGRYNQPIYRGVKFKHNTRSKVGLKRVK